ncbi:hypothetical protein ACHAWU_006427, partial [Discostella pseudostelligera]
IGGKHGASSSSIARASDSTLPPHLSLPVSVSLSPSTMAKLTILVFLVAACAAVEVLGFAPSHNIHIISPSTYYTRAASFLHSNSPTPSASDDTDDDTTNSASADEQLTVEEQQKIGNLVADAEWAGLSMELADVVRTAVIEDLKKNSRDFLGKEDYLVGDFSKEIDKRVKAEIAKIREKDEYELGDLSVVLDGKVKELVCEMSGKEEYEFGDLSIEIDKRVKESVASFCGKESYEFGDLSKELAKRMKSGVASYTGKSGYKFGDITKTALKNLSGKEDYQFGDVTKKFLGNVFNKDKK